ncbi:MAG: nucleotidyl transferase AbiEii/AbiGii toxin family protein, partial [Proteobacteria bacterium]|nr:nucleotidyl transferase AbiEii/AbiGii toxin family protein [Pseudomonadota bacterium]
MKNRPMTRVNLDKAIARMAGEDPRMIVDIRMSMANAIVGQFLSEGVVKGGTSLKFRFGSDHARYTLDLDTAWKTDLDTFLTNFRRKLSEGWEGFAGEVVIRPQQSPVAVPFDYVMQPCDVKLSYMGRSWCTVCLEIGHNEVGDADEAEMTPVPQDLAMRFEELCFPVPKALPLMRLPFQIAQKLHGATGVRSRRAHDLIDLQLILGSANVDLSETRA